MRRLLLILVALIVWTSSTYAQPCTEPGQTPSTAFSVCNTNAFEQTKFPARCKNHPVPVPTCSIMPNGDFTDVYQDLNPFWYRFICSKTGTFGFIIDPHDTEVTETQDFDWQLFDITGRNPDDVYTDSTIVVAGNWAGSYGTTGATAFGNPGIRCASEYDRYAAMPTIIEGHEYLLLVSSFTDSKDGYTLRFDYGTASINDSIEAKLVSAKADCDNNITVKLNKKLRCNTLTATGTEFSISPANATVIAASSSNCSTGASFLDEVTLTLSNPLPAGDYQLIVDFGDDGNTLLDNCDRGILHGEKVPFKFRTVQPIFADSIGSLGCSPGSVKLYFPKRIRCNTIAADGSDFLVSGPSPVSVVSAYGDCEDGLTETITIQFSSNITGKGDYVLTLKAGTDGSRLVDECDIEMPEQTIGFHAQDDVSARFSYNSQLSCRVNTLNFFHDETDDIQSWQWLINDSLAGVSSSQTIKVPASGTNIVQLIVSNGLCSDTTQQTISMNNEVKADFDMPNELCPEEAVVVTEKSAGRVDLWKWTFGDIASSDLENPAPQYFPRNNLESIYPVKLSVFSSALGCSDSITKPLKVFRYCYIAVPNAFTPNNDGVNDLLFPSNAGRAVDLDFTVFNRWGQKVFTTRNWQVKWDGKVKGVMQPPGVYVWYLKYTDSATGQKVFQKGTTSLLR